MASRSSICPPPLFSMPPQVLEQKQASVGANTIMGTDHVYVIPGAGAADGGAGGDASKKAAKRLGVLASMPADVDVAITPEEMEGLDDAQVWGCVWSGCVGLGHLGLGSVHS